MIVETLKNMLSTGPIKITFDKSNDKNPHGFLYERGYPNSGPQEVIVFSYIQVAGNAAGNCFVALCTIDGKKCTRNIPELQLKGEIQPMGKITHVKQSVRLLATQWLFQRE